MRLTTGLLSASLVLVAASVAACSTGSKTPAAAGSSATVSSIAASSTASSPAVNTAATTTTTVASAATSTAPTSAGNGAGSGKAFNVCVALPAAAASRITGTRFTTIKASTVGTIFNCEYSNTSDALLQIGVQTTGGKIGYDSIVSTLKAVNHAPNSVSGVGDEAFSEPDPKGNAGSVGASSFASFGALFGDTFIQIGGLTYVTAGQGKQIVELLHGKM